jgi:cell division protein FtsN
VAQARRTKKAKASPRRGSGRTLKNTAAAFKHGLGFFVSGALTGVLSLLFWQGYHSNQQGDMGSGFRVMMDQSRMQAEKRAAQSVAPEPVLIDKAPRQKQKYDFYTVLPEIEEVMPKDASDSPPPVSTIKTIAKSEATKSPPRAKPRQVSKALAPGSSFVLQVVSYGQRADAERLKARLALGGMQANVQKVSIDKKNFYRVRLGPYSDYGSMTADDYKLSSMGFKAMRLRISKAG